MFLTNGFLNILANLRFKVISMFYIPQNDVLEKVELTF